jgi:hypothetical protein
MLPTIEREAGPADGRGGSRAERVSDYAGRLRGPTAQADSFAELQPLRGGAQALGPHAERGLQRDRRERAVLLEQRAVARIATPTVRVSLLVSPSSATDPPRACRAPPRA